MDDYKKKGIYMDRRTRARAEEHSEGEIGRCLLETERNLISLAYRKSTGRYFPVKVFEACYLPRCHDGEAKVGAEHKADGFSVY